MYLLIHYKIVVRTYNQLLMLSWISLIYIITYYVSLAYVGTCRLKECIILSTTYIIKGSNSKSIIKDTHDPAYGLDNGNHIVRCLLTSPVKPDFVYPLSASILKN